MCVRACMCVCVCGGVWGVVSMNTNYNGVQIALG